MNSRNESGPHVVLRLPLPDHVAEVEHASGLDQQQRDFMFCAMFMFYIFEYNQQYSMQNMHGPAAEVDAHSAFEDDEGTMGVISGAAR
jgi:hypothetical protein